MTGPTLFPVLAAPALDRLTELSARLAEHAEEHYRDVLCGRVHTPQDDSIVAAAGQAALSR
jgi:hypothetical protein